MSNGCLINTVQYAVLLYYMEDQNFKDDLDISNMNLMLVNLTTGEIRCILSHDNAQLN